MKRRWWHRFYVVEVVPAHRQGGLLVTLSRTRIEAFWSERRARKVAGWYNAVRDPWEVAWGLECVVEPA